MLCLGTLPARSPSRAAQANVGVQKTWVGRGVAEAEFEAWMAHSRVLGDSARATSIDWMVERWRDQGALVERDDFRAIDATTGELYALTNVVASFRPSAPRQFVLASHFDIRPWAEDDPDPARRDVPIPGANDGTSGVAVIGMITRPLLEHLPTDVGWTVINFDGEELGHPESARDGYCIGSRRFAAQSRSGPWQRADFALVLDMVGDRDLALRIDPYSQRHHSQLVADVWASAMRDGYTAFVTELGPALIDDHVYLSEAGLPAILLIDRDTPTWHTHADDREHLSVDSLVMVANAVTSFLVKRYAEAATSPCQTRHPQQPAAASLRRSGR